MGIILLVRFFFSSFSVGSGNWLGSLVGRADLEKKNLTNSMIPIKELLQNRRLPHR